MPIPTLPTAPNTARPDTFAIEMDAWIAAIAAWTIAVNEIGGTYSLLLIGSSATSLTIGTGSKSLTMETGLAYMPGSAIIIASTASPSNRMNCTVTSYNSATGALVVNADSVGGSGTFAAWSISATSTASFDNQTFTNLVLAGKITETSYVLAGTAIDAANGSIQTKTLSAVTTFTDSMVDGTSIVLVLTAGAYTAIWPTMTWLWGSAPILSTTGKTFLVVFKIGTTLYGVNAGPA